MNESIKYDIERLSAENEMLKKNIIEMQNHLNTLYANLDSMSKMTELIQPDLSIKQCFKVIWKKLTKRI